MLACRRRVAAVGMRQRHQGRQRARRLPQHGDQLCSRARSVPPCPQTVSQPSRRWPPVLDAPAAKHSERAHRTTDPRQSAACSQQPQPQLQRHQPPRTARQSPGRGRGARTSTQPLDGERRVPRARPNANTADKVAGLPTVRRAATRPCNRCPIVCWRRYGGTPALPKARSSADLLAPGTGCCTIRCSFSQLYVQPTSRRFCCTLQDQHGDASASEKRSTSYPPAADGVPGTRDGFATKSFEINRWDWQHGANADPCLMRRAAAWLANGVVTGSTADSACCLCLSRRFPSEQTSTNCRQQRWTRTNRGDAFGLPDGALERRSTASPAHQLYQIPVVLPGPDASSVASLHLGSFLESQVRPCMTWTPVCTMGCSRIHSSHTWTSDVVSCEAYQMMPG